MFVHLAWHSGYLPKFSDSFAAELMNNDATDFNLCRRILSDYHPLQPEMVLQLAAQQYPQFFGSGQVRKESVPVPWEASELPIHVRTYMACKWRGESMTLLDYLRLSGQEGQIHQRYHRLHKALGIDIPKEQWVNNIKPMGEILVAPVMYSRNSDRFYGQWLLLHVPFRSIDDLWDAEAEKVPKELRFLCLCLLKAGNFWRRPQKVRHDMELEARAAITIENMLAQLAARTELCDAYLEGSLTVEEHPEPPLRGLEKSYPVRLAPEQQHVVDAVARQVDRAMRARWPEDAGDWDPDVWADWAVSRSDLQTKPAAVLGPAGSGKTTAVEMAIRYAVDKGAHVGIATPTGMQSSSYKAKFPELDVDTAHGMFGLHMPEFRTLEMMAHFDFVVLEEIGQLSQAQFERIMKLWDAAGRRPGLLACGDFGQLRGVEPRNAKDSPRWNDLNVIRLVEMRRCKCAKLKAALQLLRSSVPSGRQLKKILKGHRAPTIVGPHYDPNALPRLAEIKQILKETPDTQFVTCTRAGTHHLNTLAVEALFEDAELLDTLDCEPESDPDNFWRGEQIAAAPYKMPLYEGMKVTITKNEDKEHSFVNGMGGVVLERRRSGVLIVTDTKERILVHPVTKYYALPEGRQVKAVYFPLRPGYSTTLHKIQGATVPHLTVWLDMQMEAAAYVALSRVQYDKNWRFLGFITPQHCRPSRSV